MEQQTAPASQTLSRGLLALEYVAEARTAPTIAELSDALGLHRSITYRIVRTLEAHGFVVRNAAGALELGPRLAALAHNVSRDLQSAALPELTGIADDLGMTAFVAVLDPAGSEAVTLTSVEPRHAGAVVAQHPGSRHPIERGAPGRAIAAQLAGGVPAPYETSHDEVIPGLSSVAVPLAVRGQRPAALAVVYLTRTREVAAIADRLARSADAIRAAMA